MNNRISGQQPQGWLSLSGSGAWVNSPAHDERKGQATFRCAAATVSHCERKAIR